MVRLSGANLAIVAACSAMPTSPSAYVLARQMGGDAPLLAQIITLQTIFAAITMPIVIALVTVALRHCGARRAKQSRLPPRKDTGLLRCARNDGARANAVSLIPVISSAPPPPKLLNAVDDYRAPDRMDAMAEVAEPRGQS